MEWTCKKRFIVFPVRHDAKKKRICFYEDKKIVYTICLICKYVFFENAEG